MAPFLTATDTDVRYYPFLLGGSRINEPSVWAKDPESVHLVAQRHEYAPDLFWFMLKVVPGVSTR